MAIGSNTFWGLFDRLIAAPIDWVLEQLRKPDESYEDEEGDEYEPPQLTADEINEQLDHAAKRQ